MYRNQCLSAESFFLLQVGQMVHALKMGWMKPSKPDEDKDEDEENQNIFFNIWNEDEEVTQIEE